MTLKFGSFIVLFDPLKYLETFYSNAYRQSIFITVITGTCATVKFKKGLKLIGTAFYGLGKCLHALIIWLTRTLISLSLCINSYIWKPNTITKI